MAKRRRKRGLGGHRIPERGRCEITPHATVADLKGCAKACGSPYFDKDTMRFFRSRVGSKVYADGKGGAIFTTSEQFVGSQGAAQRRYSVRRYDAATCSFDTVGEFQAYKTSAQANAAAKRIAHSSGLSGRKRRR